jgi:hypothetical protein
MEESVDALHSEFEKAMRHVYTRARDEAGYNATYFVRMLSEHGGLATAQRLLAVPTASDGFTALWERQRLDLTLEAQVVQPKFAPLFTEAEVDVARQRLHELGYHV